LPSYTKKVGQPPLGIVVAGLVVVVDVEVDVDVVLVLVDVLVDDVVIVVTLEQPILMISETQGQ
jgi:hypothetical protein